MLKNESLEEKFDIFVPLVFFHDNAVTSQPPCIPAAPNPIVKVKAVIETMQKKCVDD